MSNMRSDNLKYKKQIPFKVKSSERDCINLAFANITMDKNDGVTFKPIKNVVYLWVYTEKKEIVIGIEEPWRYPQAFIDVSDAKSAQYFEKNIKPHLMNSSQLGHVTLSCLFSQAPDKRGKVEPQDGKAFIGGEMKFTNGKWLINNESGRFGLLKNNPKAVQFLMHEVVLAFEFAMDFKPDFSISLPNHSYLLELYNIWDMRTTDVERALLILDDYAKPYQSELILSGIWSEANKNFIVVRELLAILRADPMLRVETILESFTVLLDSGVIDSNIYLVRRLKFIAGQTNHYFKLNEKNKSNQSLGISN